MPHHAHLLVEGPAVQSDLRRFVKLAKQRSGAAHAPARGKTLWQEGYRERVRLSVLRVGRWPLDELW